MDHIAVDRINRNFVRDREEIVATYFRALAAAGASEEYLRRIRRILDNSGERLAVELRIAANDHRAMREEAESRVVAPVR